MVSPNAASRYSQKEYQPIKQGYVLRFTLQGMYLLTLER